MLSRLVINDVVLIERLTLEFGGGLSVLTGETGAGKSILLDSLGLALGARADSMLVRAGAAQASVSASFDLADSHELRRLLDEQGIACDDEIILRRVVRADGGSRAFINDAPVSAALLRECGDRLAEIHGQNDDRGLLQPRGHRLLLDAFGGLGSAVALVAERWSKLETAVARLADAIAVRDAAEADRDWLTHAADELTALAARPGEEQDLADRRAAMMKGARLGEELALIRQCFEGSDAVPALLRSAARRLERVAHEHEALAATLAALDRALVEIEEADAQLRAAGDALAHDPQRLEDAETRLFELRAMARKHRVEVDALPALAETLSARREALDAGGAGVAALEAAVGAAQIDYDAAADALTAARADAAARLDASVARELKPLKLDAARFRTRIEPDEPGPGGRDRVEFEIATNPGASFAPLTRIASGGELSRFILALKVALAGSRQSAAMIFDEIDRGVGGAVASAIGERLARLAAGTQVLVVTHSPQVAARGAAHYRIDKRAAASGARTEVVALTPEQRREEIARMLSAAAVTDEARAQAARLLEDAL